MKSKGRRDGDRVALFACESACAARRGDNLKKCRANPAQRKKITLTSNVSRALPITKVEVTKQKLN
ncbi:MAG: hypothetical protein CFK52_08910 [Chloracidobacterium sp. CP2_5A]|nr:MAG: hypothetical protein CFK52_08910 [Chloracidobacterium sp. CP2_5A]